jgi:6-phosphogluconate dehydrogenase
VKAQLGIVGLGRIGANLARLGLRRKLRLAGYTLGKPPRIGRGFRKARDLASLCALLEKPRRVILYVPAGHAVDSLIDSLAMMLEPGDVIADGGNSYWGDSIRRQRRLRTLDIDFVDVGTSGGVPGASTGACFMVGGEARAVAKVAPILKRLAVKGGYVHAGGPGAGHFVKLVHNGIEFGMLQAIGEGIALLRRHGGVEVEESLACWRHGSVIRSWLIDLMHEQYARTHDIESVPDEVEDTGEVNWLVDDALRLEVPVPVIAQSVMALLDSRLPGDDAARAVAMMRNAFGGHAYGRSRAIARERESSRVGPFVPPDRGQRG